MSRVRFHENVYVKWTLSLDDISCNEIDSIWYTEDEFERMRKRNKTFMQVVDQASPDVQNFVGKTYGVNVNSRKNKARRIEECLSAVLGEQDRQWRQGENDDPAMIALVSRTVTKTSEHAARRRGWEIAKETLTERIAQAIREVRGVTFRRNHHDLTHAFSVSKKDSCNPSRAPPVFMAAPSC